MFDLSDSWVWDFWFADDGERYHMFFLYASRALHDPDRRHYRASVGHAVSRDLVAWQRLADALVRSDAPAFDDLATWTGSVVRDRHGLWRMFYTGATLAPSGQNRQSVGQATSNDLLTWTKTSTTALLSADGDWYETLADGCWGDEAFRDPWVFADPDGVWHMLITARARSGASLGRGVVGHAVSDNLDHWELTPPLSRPSEVGFGQLEVMQVEVVDGHLVLIFSCLGSQASPAKRVAGGAIWAVNAESVTGPFEIDSAYPLLDDEWYVGRLLKQRGTGEWLLFAFRNRSPESDFVGGVSNPMPVNWQKGRLTVR